MTTENLIAQIRAQAPEMPHHTAAAFLQEFLLRIYSEGNRDAVEIPRTSGNGYVYQIPDRVVSVSDVFADGVRLSPTLTEAGAMRIMHAHAPYDPRAILTIWEEGGVTAPLLDHDSQTIYSTS